MCFKIIIIKKKKKKAGVGKRSHLDFKRSKNMAHLHSWVEPAHTQREREGEREREIINHPIKIVHNSIIIICNDSISYHVNKF